jgi:EmrB/QacA subfamily drug resistance transporter
MSRSDTAAAERLDSGMTHREVVEALSGLLLGMFVAILSSTVVTTALPRIIGDLGGGQSAYTWVVTSTLLALTVSTPIWGKLADIFDRKVLVQTGLAIYTLGSILAGLSESTSWLIGCRVLQGLGVGGLTALVQVILADLVSPRERGRYAGYLGAVFGLGTVAGPLIGGVLTDGLGWRWCFYVGVPFAVAAFVVLQRTLHLPRHRREGVRIDWAGATLIAGGIATLLIWVSLGGQSFPWASTETAILVPLSALLLLAAVAVERRAKDPVVPLRLFGDRVVVLAVLASAAVGVGLFGSTVFLGQYAQLARGMTPTEAGLLSIPLVVGLALSSTVVGRAVSATGRYKRPMLAGTAAITVGLGLMGTVDERTPLPEVAVFLVLTGLGVGAVMQNLVLVVQNTVGRADMGAGSSLVAFCRTLGGAVGVAGLGAVLAHHAKADIATGLAAQGIDASRLEGGTSRIPNVHELPGPLQRVFEHAYAAGVAEVFLIAAPLAALAFVLLLALPERPLGRRSGIEQAREAAATA